VKNNKLKLENFTKDVNIRLSDTEHYSSHRCLVLLRRGLGKNVPIGVPKIFITLLTLTHVNIQQNVRGISLIINHVKALASTI